MRPLQAITHTSGTRWLRCLGWAAGFNYSVVFKISDARAGRRNVAEVRRRSCPETTRVRREAVP